MSDMNISFVNNLYSPASGRDVNDSKRDYQKNK